MLKILFFELSVLILCFALEPLPEDIETPWTYEYHWPGNISVVDYTYSPPLEPGWNSDALDRSLIDLQLDDADDGDCEMLSQALANYSKAQSASEKMREFRDYGVLPYFVDVDWLCATYGLFNCTCFAVGNVFTCDVPYSDRVRYSLAMRIFSKEYSEAWQGTMGNTIGCLEHAASTWNNEARKLDGEYAEVDYAGLCDLDYVGCDRCLNATNYLYSAGLDASGEMGELRAGFAEVAAAVQEDVPSFRAGSLLRRLMDRECGEVVKVQSIILELERYREDSSNLYKKEVAGAIEAIGKAEESKTISESHELWRINEYGWLGSEIGDDAASVNSITSRAEDDFRRATDSLGQAKNIYADGRAGYCKNATAAAANSKQFAAEADNGFRNGVEVGFRVVRNYEVLAVEKIELVEKRFAGGLWPSEATALYAAAQDRYSEGSGETKIGRQFQFFTESIKYSEEALLVDPAGQPDTNVPALAKCAVALDLLERAESDGVDVSFEKMEYQVVSGSKNATVLIDGCNQVIDGVTRNAQARYNKLEGLRQNVTWLLSICGAECDDLQKELQASETGLVSNGKMLYPNVIGSLRFLEIKYYALAEDAENSLGLLVGERLRVSKEIYMETPTLDQEDEVELHVIIENKVPYPGGPTRVDFECDLPFMEEDFVEIPDFVNGVAYVDGHEIIYLNEIGANERVLLGFRKNTTLVKTLKARILGVGNPDGSANIKETRDFECEGDIRGFYAPANWARIFIDGSQASNQNGYIARDLAQGEHTLGFEYVDFGAFNSSTYINTSSVVGSRAYISYAEVVESRVDLDYAIIPAKISKNPNVHEVKASTITGERVSVIETATDYMVKVYGVKTGIPLRYQVTYYVDDTADYVKGELLKINLSGLSPDAEELFWQVDAALENNDSETAIVKLNELNELIVEEGKKASRTEAQILEITKLVRYELGEIDYSNAEVVSGEFGQQIGARRQYLASLLAQVGSENNENELRLLEGYDSKWLGNFVKNYKKRGFEEMNELQVYCLDYGCFDENISYYLGEARTAYRVLDAGSQLDDAVKFEVIMERVRELVGDEQIRTANAIEGQIQGCQEMLGKTGAVYDKYASELENAEDTRFQSAFTIDKNDVKNLLKEAGAQIKKRNQSWIVNYCGGLELMSNDMGMVIQQLESNAVNGGHNLEFLFRQKAGNMNEGDVREFLEVMVEYNKSVENRQWVKALKKLDQGIGILGVGSGFDFGMVVWVGAAVVLFVVAFYYIKDKRRGFFAGKERKFKKLEKAV